MRRVGVFVNVTNQFYSVLTAFRGGKVDYTKYLRESVSPEGYELYRAIAYGVQIGNEAQSFIAALQRAGYDTRYKPAKVVDGKANVRDTDWAIGMAMDVIRHLEHLDVVVLGCNDPSLIPLVEFIKERGIRVVIYSCRIPQELQRAADYSFEISEDVLETKRSQPQVEEASSNEPATVAE